MMTLMLVVVLVVAPFLIALAVASYQNYRSK